LSRLVGSLGPRFRGDERESVNQLN
jgi:hypothetical protein